MSPGVFERSGRVWREGHRLQHSGCCLHLAGPRCRRRAERVADASGEGRVAVHREDMIESFDVFVTCHVK